jgi:hypothetical protein
MTDEVEIVHVAWGPSRVDSIRDALRLKGSAERVIALSHALNVGPIDTLDADARRVWARANLRDDDPNRDWHEPEAPWSEATSLGAHPVYWVCLTDAGDHASFLEFASRMAGRPFDIVDATGLDLATIGGISPVWSLGQVRPEEIVASGLVERRRPFSQAESDAAVEAWSRLRRENAPLRIMREGRLISAPLSHFDAVLTTQAKRERELLIELIGRALDHLDFEADPPGQGTGDELLFARVLALGEADALEVTGSGLGMRDYEVRLPDDHSLA